MKRLLFFLCLSVAFCSGASAQAYGGATLFGKTENRLEVLYNLAVPDSRYSIPTTKQGKPHIAYESGSLYLWNPAASQWVQYAPFNLSTIRNAIIKIGTLGSYDPSTGVLNINTPGLTEVIGAGSYTTSTPQFAGGLWTDGADIQLGNPYGGVSGGLVAANYVNFRLSGGTYTTTIQQQVSGQTSDILLTLPNTAGRLALELGYTAENTANKAINFTVLNNTLYPTTQAVANYVSGLGYQTALGYTAEDVANKATDFTTLNNTKYPTTQAVSNYLSSFNYLSSSSASGTYFPLSGGTITGTGGAGFVGLPSQSSAPAATTGVTKLYADASGRFRWRTGLGFSRGFTSTSLTADRIYTLPDADLSIAMVPTSDNNLTVNASQQVTTNKAVQSLTDATSISWDMSSGYNAAVTLAGNRTLSITGAQAGQFGLIKVTQDATGSRTITLPSGSKVINGSSGAVTLTTTAGATDILTFFYDGTSYFWTIGKNYN